MADLSESYGLLWTQGTGQIRATRLNVQAFDDSLREM